MMILKEFSRIVCVSLFSYQGSLLSVSQTAHLLYHIFRNVSSAFFKFFSNLSGEGGIWTLAPLLTTYSLSRGAPSASLGTSPNCPTQSLLFFQKRFILYRVVFHLSRTFLKLFSFSTAERVGFEPTRPCGQTVFKTASLWPLRYLSICCWCAFSLSAQVIF